MPTVIALDVSLSMCGCGATTNSNQTKAITLRELAVQGIKTLLSYVKEYAVLESVSFSVFARNYETIEPLDGSFTRDFDEIRRRLTDTRLYTTTSIHAALTVVSLALRKEQSGQCRAIIVTDGICSAFDQCSDVNYYPLPLPQNADLNFICIQPPHLVPRVEYTVAFFRRLIAANNNRGAVYEMPSDVSTVGLDTVINLFWKTSEVIYAPCTGLLCFGNLSCKVQFYPSSAADRNGNNNDILNILAFPTRDLLESAPFSAKYALLPVVEGSTPEETPHFAVVLLKALAKRDASGGNASQATNRVALVEIQSNEEANSTMNISGKTEKESEKQYGLIHLAEEGRKKTPFLMLTILRRGARPIPWLPPLSTFVAGTGPQTRSAQPPSSAPLTLQQLAIHGGYFSSDSPCNSWLHPEHLSSDITKLVRMAKKVREKQPQFYKELNRFRTQAIADGWGVATGAVIPNGTESSAEQKTQQTSIFDFLARALEADLAATPQQNSGGVDAVTMAHINYVIQFLRDPASRANAAITISMPTFG